MQTNQVAPLGPPDYSKGIGDTLGRNLPARNARYRKQFPGVKALDHARLQLRPGSIHALMGENGAGKSTLMKCLFGIYKRTRAPSG